MDDEARIREVVEYALKREGYRVSMVGDGAAALEVLERGDVDLVVLDVMMPEVDGLEVCRRIRARAPTPILFLSARSEEVDRIVGLELGGDDYLVKPFSPRELVARVRAVLRRAMAAESAEPRPTVLRHGVLELDLERHEVRYGTQHVVLTATEFAVLWVLAERPGVVWSRSQLMERVYPHDGRVTERTIDTHVRRIRAKFRAAGADPVATVHGVGYKVGDA